MFIATLLSLFKTPKAFVWQPAITLVDPQIVSALLTDSGR